MRMIFFSFFIFFGLILSGCEQQIQKTESSSTITSTVNSTTINKTEQKDTKKERSICDGPNGMDRCATNKLSAPSDLRDPLP